MSCDPCQYLGKEQSFTLLLCTSGDKSVFDDDEEVSVDVGDL